MNKAASEMGKLSARKQKEKMGEYAYIQMMRKRGKLGGRPKKYEKVSE